MFQASASFAYSEISHVAKRFQLGITRAAMIASQNKESFSLFQKGSKYGINEN